MSAGFIVGNFLSEIEHVRDSLRVAVPTPEEKREAGNTFPPFPFFFSYT